MVLNLDEVQYGELLEGTREHIEKNHQRSVGQTFLRRFAIEKIFPFPGRMKLALAPVGVIRALGLERWLPKYAREELALVPKGAREGRWPTQLRYSPFEPAKLLESDADLPCGLRAVLAPGHTPGNIVVVQRAEGWLFSGDQLLPEVTPTPAPADHAAPVVHGDLAAVLRVRRTLAGVKAPVRRARLAGAL